MKKLKLNLHQFDDPATYTVTCYSDAGYTAFSASPASGAKGTEVALTITPKSGYEVDKIEVVAGGVTITGTTNKKITIDEANVVLYAKSKGSAMYKVVENRDVSVNGAVTSLTRNMKLVISNCGAVVGVDCAGTDLSSLSADMIDSLVKEGVIVKM